MTKINKGEYAAFLNGKNEIIGGAIFWNKDEKNEKIFWTSCWYLFNKDKVVKVEFYVIKNDVLEIVNVRNAILNISHNIILNRELKGTIQIICM